MVSIKQLKLNTMKLTFYNLSWKGIYYRFYLLAFLAPVALLISPLVAGILCFPIFMSLVMGISITSETKEQPTQAVIRTLETRARKIAS